MRRDEYLRLLARLERNGIAKVGTLSISVARSACAWDAHKSRREMVDLALKEYYNVCIRGQQ